MIKFKEDYRGKLTGERYFVAGDVAELSEMAEKELVRNGIASVSKAAPSKIVGGAEYIPDYVIAEAANRAAEGPRKEEKPAEDVQADDSEPVATDDVTPEAEVAPEIGLETPLSEILAGNTEPAPDAPTDEPGEITPWQFADHTVSGAVDTVESEKDDEEDDYVEVKRQKPKRTTTKKKK